MKQHYGMVRCCEQNGTAKNGKQYKKHLEEAHFFVRYRGDYAHNIRKTKEDAKACAAFTKRVSNIQFDLRGHNFFYNGNC